MMAEFPQNGEESQAVSFPQWGATAQGVIRTVAPVMGNNLQKLRRERRWTHDQAAAAMGMSRGGFIKLERGERRLTEDYIARAAKAFGVPVSSVVSDRTEIPVMGMIGAGAIVEPDYEQIPPDGLYAVDLPFPVPDDMIAFEVKGDSMLPRYDEGDVIIVWREQRRTTDSFIGEEAVVRTERGARYLKRILQGPRRGTFTLGSFNARAIEGVRIVWVGEIYVTIRSGQLRGIENKPRTPAPRRRRARSNDAAGGRAVQLRRRATS